MRNYIAAALVAWVVTGGMGAGAQEEVDLFTRLDSNKDGYVSLDEVPDEHKATFEQMLRTAGKEEEKKLNKPLFQAAVKVRERSRQAPPGPAVRGGREAGNAGPQDLEALFDRTDANSDGKLSKDEVPEHRQLIRRVFERIGSDAITKEQFLQAMSTLAQAGERPPGPPEVRRDGPPWPPGLPGRGPGGLPPGGGLFALLDADRDGQLSTSEIVGAGTALLKLDRNGDGKVTPDEAFAPPNAGPDRPEPPRRR